jgi:hypothetical protein
VIVAAAKKRRKPVVDRKAREMIRQTLDIIEDLIDQNERQWNSLMSAWVDIDILKDQGKLAEEARKLERELEIK